MHQNARQNEYRQRRSLEITNWQLADILYKYLSQDDTHRSEIGNRVKRSEVPLELRPVGGPINIEQLPAMLAARYVKRYPYSQKDDPDIIG
ncbi:unnamed protein product [Rotaria magnacalcarata]|uniref:Uncharacterized protein n=1 Tax=Rotaria magnacalcarata TaxID=392030 RepID=A0A816FTL8_9BILA|nr:unnamed protein product [Rotaria magnacalcarata]CAF1665934.1 unnamed protein product [Rotaria magnacalcarata]CAF2048277.1 unnamed protein product [Rotaria magnacalcarata]CAF2062864.1 unnamed protein product [Rotaria magnacalcarata]CAF2078916.1 unnamed protein product [Rotaria magnacalcarata]